MKKQIPPPVPDTCGGCGSEYDLTYYRVGKNFYCICKKCLKEEEKEEKYRREEYYSNLM